MYQSYFFTPHCSKAHLHLFSDPSISSISLSIFSCSTTLTFCREKQTKHCLTPNTAPQTLTYPLLFYFPGRHQNLLKSNYQQLKRLIFIIIKQQHLLVTSSRLRLTHEKLVLFSTFRATRLSCPFDFLTFTLLSAWHRIGESSGLCLLPLSCKLKDYLLAQNIHPFVA